MSADAETATPILQHFIFKIAMSCGGCSGAITRILSKYPGVVKFNVSLETQTAEVWATLEVIKYALAQKLMKSGKTMHSATVDGQVIELEKAKAYEAPA